jgi:LEA14-like dessication related protein
MLKIVTAVFLSFAAAGCAPGERNEAEALHVSLVSMAPLEMGVFEQRYTMRLRVQNPRPHEVPLQGISLDLDVNGRSFARATGRTETVIPAFGEETIEVTAVSTLPDVLARLQELSSLKGDEGVNYRLQGRLYQGTSGVYERFTYGGELNLKSDREAGGRTSRYR